ncbi:HNH endonuclease [Mycobacterium phage Auspice]|nr:HNH endonuclease [Mycobacterium phage Auspice]
MAYKDPSVQREYMRRWVANRRSAFFASKQCAMCGAGEELELDHIDPTKKVDHRIWSWTDARRSEELAKCQVLCASCHKKKTGEQWYANRSVSENAHHGTSRRYRKMKCRCGLCRLGNTNRSRALRQRHRVPVE